MWVAKRYWQLYAIDLRHFELHLPANDNIKLLTRQGRRNDAEALIDEHLKQQKWHEPVTP
jgi:hypothetical protein